MKYIKIYDNVIPEALCSSLIYKFNQNQNLQIKRETDSFIFNEINFSQNENSFSKESEILFEVFTKYIRKYQEDCGVTKYQFPPKMGFESIRMKHYISSHGEFKPHVDNYNLDSSRRFLVFFLYLDEGVGGGTHFFNENFTCERKPGRLLMFPPSWTYPHAGLMPENKDKYIIGSYLHFAE